MRVVPVEEEAPFQVFERLCSPRLGLNSCTDVERGVVRV